MWPIRRRKSSCLKRWVRAPPAFGHHNLLIGGDGEALSKRKGSLSVEGLRKEGLEPLAINAHAATIGSSHPVAPHQSMDDIAGAV